MRNYILTQVRFLAVIVALVAVFAVASGSRKPPEPPERVTTMQEVRDAATASSCASYRFPEKGKAPGAFVRGMALVYAKALCAPERTDLPVVTRPLGSKSSDAMALYGLEPTLRNVYTLMMGSGMRESNGKHCEGRDLAAGNTSSETAEAGMFQTSYNSRSANPELPKLMAKYRSSDAGCLLEDFKTSGCTASDAKTYGTGDGAVFQVRQKACPSFAAEWHAVMLRVRMNHYGPIKRREAKFATECAAMFQKVEELVTPALCAELAKH